MRELNYTFPEGIDFVGLRLTEQGYEATVRTSIDKLDRHGQPVPPQIGWGFKGRTIQQAFRAAEADARSKLNRVLTLRNQRPKLGEPKLTEEQELSQLLGL